MFVYRLEYEWLRADAKTWSKQSDCYADRRDAENARKNMSACPEHYRNVIVIPTHVYKAGIYKDKWGQS